MLAQRTIRRVNFSSKLHATLLIDFAVPLQKNDRLEQEKRALQQSRDRLNARERVV